MATPKKAPVTPKKAAAPKKKAKVNELIVMRNAILRMVEKKRGALA